jgi:hypothetical protein
MEAKRKHTPKKPLPATHEELIADLDGLDWQIAFEENKEHWKDPEIWASNTVKFESFVRGRDAEQAIAKIVRSGFPRWRLVLRYAKLIQAIRQHSAPSISVEPTFKYESVERARQCDQFSVMAATLADRLEKHWREAPLPLKSWKMPTDFLGEQLKIAAGMPKLLRNYAKVLKIEAQMYRRPRGRRRSQLLDDLTALFARKILLTCGSGRGLHSQTATLVDMAYQEAGRPAGYSDRNLRRLLAAKA